MVRGFDSEKSIPYINNIGSWKEGIWEWNWNWRWRRFLFGREVNSFNSIFSLITRFSPKKDVKDGWRWEGNAAGRYTTKDAYDLLNNVDNSRRNDQLKEINLISSRKIVPLQQLGERSEIDYQLITI